MKKNLLRISCAAILLATLVWSCQKENLAAEADEMGSPSLQGLSLDPNDYCGSPDTLDLANVAGNEIVDYCGSQPCNPNTPLPWGKVVYAKHGTVSPVCSLALETSLAPGWTAESASLLVTPPGFIPLNGNVPAVGTGWSTTIFAPTMNQFLLDVELPGSLYGATCFDWSLQVQVVRVSIFGLPDPASRRTLFAYDAVGSGSPYVIDRCYDACPPSSVTITKGSCQGCRARVSVTFNSCTSVDITSCKQIRQVVIVYDDCTRQTFNNLTGTSRHYDAAPGKTISHVFVRSGCKNNQDDDDDNGCNGSGGSGSGNGGGHGGGNNNNNFRRFRFDGPCFNAACLNN